MTLARTIAITLTASVAFGMVAASCTPRTPKTAPSVLEGPTTPTTIKPLVVRVDETEAGSTDGAVAEEAVVVDFALPRGCEKIYDPKDACKTLRALIDTPGRMNNRACLSRLSAIIHGYAFGCRWIDFSSYRDGYGADCYRHLYTGGRHCLHTLPLRPPGSGRWLHSVRVDGEYLLSGRAASAGNELKSWRETCVS